MSLLDILRESRDGNSSYQKQCTVISECADLDQRYFMYKSIHQGQIPPQESVQLPEDEEDKINNKQLENSPHQNTGSPLDFPDTEEPNNGTDSPNGQEHVEESTGIGSRLPTRERFLLQGLVWFLWSACGLLVKILPGIQIQVFGYILLQ